MNDMIVGQLQTRLIKWLSRTTTSLGLRRFGEFPIVIGSDIGAKRNENQDRVAVLKFQENPNRSILIAALCDGMGGMTEGADCAVHAMAYFLSACFANKNLAPEKRIICAAHEANERVYSLYSGKGGATLSAIMIDNKMGVTGVNVGDSRIYCFSEKSLIQLTTDDTMAAIMKNSEKDGILRNELLQFIGIGDSIDPHIIKFNNNYNNYNIILTSDGIHYLKNDILKDLINIAKDNAIAAKRILDISQWLGGNDNASIAIIPSKANDIIKDADKNILHICDPYGDLQILLPQPEKSIDKANYLVKDIVNITENKNTPFKRKKVLKKSTPKYIENENNKIEKAEDKQPLLNIIFNKILEDKTND